MCVKKSARRAGKNHFGSNNPAFGPERKKESCDWCMERDEKMGCPHEMRPDMSVTDIALRILKNRGKTIHFKELISEVMAVKAINQENSGRLIAQMHTEISLDSRFIHHGNGEWGLREWQNKGSKIVKIRPESPSAPTRSRPLLRDDEEDDLVDEEEEEFVAEEEESEEDEYESEPDEYEDDD